MARRRYLSVVDPTWQTRVGGSACSSLYIVYWELPGGVFSTHGSSLLPVLISCPPRCSGYCLIRLLRRSGRGRLEVRQQCLPALPVPVTPVPGGGAQPFPAAVLDLHPGRGVALGNEADVHLGGVGPVPAQVPQVAELGGRFPHGHLTPVVLGPVGRALIDPPAHRALQHDDQPGCPGHGVVSGPPGADPGGPHGKARSTGQATSKDIRSGAVTARASARCSPPAAGNARRLPPRPAPGTPERRACPVPAGDRCGGCPAAVRSPGRRPSAGAGAGIPRAG